MLFIAGLGILLSTSFAAYLVWDGKPAYQLSAQLNEFEDWSEVIEGQQHTDEELALISEFTEMSKHLAAENSLENQTLTISLGFTGDGMFGRYINTLHDRYEETQPEFPLTHMGEIWAETASNLGVDDLDIKAINLEGPISDSSYVNPGTAMRFNFRPEWVPGMLAKYFTTASLANNHSYDQGEEAYMQTLDYLSAVGIDGFGYPDKVGEHSFIRYDFGGYDLGGADSPTTTTSEAAQNETARSFSIGFLGLNDAVYPLDEQAALDAMQTYDKEVDFLIVAVHWGAEYEKTARTSISDLAHTWVDEGGADFIWGHHPHVVQNNEVYNGAPIYYSLGNLVFDQYWSEETQKGLIVGLRIDVTQEQIDQNQAPELTLTEVDISLKPEGQPQLLLSVE